MEDWTLTTLNVSCLVVQGVMQLVFAGRFSDKTVKLRHMLVYLLLIVLLDWTSLRLGIAAFAAVAVQILILYAVNRLALHNSRFVSGAAAVIAVYIWQASFGLVNSAEAMLFPALIGRSLLYLLLFLDTAAAFLICAGFYAAVLKLLSLPALPTGGQTPYIVLLLLPSLFVFATEMYIIQTSYNALSLQRISLAEAGKHIGLLFLQFGGLGALLCTLYAYQRICRSFQAQAELQAVRAQKAYIAEARLRYEQTRAFRHDIKNHLAVLGGLLRREDWAAAQEYLQKLDAVSAALSFPYQTGNHMLDILLGEKLGLAGAGGITAEVDLFWPGRCGVDDFDLCVIFANALDNAINACRPLDGEKFIRIGGEAQGDFYLLCFENSCDEGPLPPTGTGLANIRTVAEKYRGAVKIEKEGGRFCLNVLLDMAAAGIS